MKTRLTVFLASLLGLGCSSPSTSDAGASPVSEAFAPAFCDWATRCCSAQLDCSAAAARALTFFGDLGAEYRAGGISVDSMAIARCRADLAAVPCDMPTELLSVPSCREAIVGHRKLGETCVEYLGCEAGLECVLGKCVPSAALGGSCDAGARQTCLNGVCHTPGCQQGLICLAGVCGTPAQVGEACSPASRICQPYRAACDCAEPLRGCLDGGVCAGLRPLDAGCVWGTQCASTACERGACVLREVGDFKCN